MNIEFLRQHARGVIGYQSSLYRAAAKSLDFVSIVQREGLTTYAALNRARNRTGRGTPLRMSFKNLRHPILIRPGTQDADTVINNIVREEYGQFTPPRDPLWMIDAGAYIGDTTAYFLSRFDTLRVISLEPNPESFPTAAANLAPYGERAILLPKGLWSRDEQLSLGGGGTGACLTGEEGSIDCVSVPTILKQHQIPRLDVLKMDIEGAEEAIFAAEPQNWLPRVVLILIEIHNERAYRLITDVLTKNGFTMQQYRSIWYCRNESLNA